MKKIFFTLFFMCGIFLLLSPGEVLWGKRKFLDEPRVHKVQKGETLSKLAKQYYGDPKRWRELALINRAPKPGHLEVGEEILVPAAPTISALRRSRTITRVNALIDEQEKVAASSASSNRSVQPQVAEPAAQVAAPANPKSNGLVPETTPETIAAPIEESGFPWFWLAIGVIIIAGAAGFIWYRHRHAEKAENEVNEVKMVEPRRSLDDRARQPFSKPSTQKEHLAI
jgi:LysM repeat protein